MSVTNPSWNLSDNMTNDCWSPSSYSHSMFSFSLLGSSALCRLSEVDEGWLRKISEDEVISSWIIDSSCLYSSQWEQKEQGSWHLTSAQICILTSPFCLSFAAASSLAPSIWPNEVSYEIHPGTTGCNKGTYVLSPSACCYAAFFFYYWC